MSPDLRLRLHATQAQPCFPAASNALALPGGNGIFTATPAERITHYTLLRKVVCQMGALPPLETPTRKGGTLPLHGAHTAFSCYSALRLYRLSKSQRGIGAAFLALGSSFLPLVYSGMGRKNRKAPKSASPRAQLRPSNAPPRRGRIPPAAVHFLSFPSHMENAGGMQRGCPPFPYVQGTRPRRRTGLAAAAGERMAGRALTGRRSPLYDGFPTGRRPRRGSRGAPVRHGPARPCREGAAQPVRARRQARSGAAAGPIRCGGRPGPA